MFSRLAPLLRFAAYPSGNIKLFCTHKRISLICPLSILNQALGFDQFFFPFSCHMFCEGLSHRVSWSTLALGLSFDFPSMPKMYQTGPRQYFFQCASRQYCVEVRGLGSRGDPRSMSCESRGVPNYIP